MEDVLATAMPRPLSSVFYSGHAADFLTTIYYQFTSGTGPSWFSAMPTYAQTYLVTYYLPVISEVLDWQGTSPTVFQGFIPTASAGSSFEIVAQVTFA